MILTESNSAFDYFKGALRAPVQHGKFMIVTILLLLFYTTTGNTVKNKSFDYFVYSQRWLPTSCIEYEEHGSDHQCSLPKNFEFWAIHGLWPTQNNHLGPFFCNRSLPFDINKLSPIEPALKLYWPNIEAGKDISSLWQHEWDKHGTCAAQLESLNTELKYFNISLNLYKTYNIQNLFQKFSIKPDSEEGLSVFNLFQIIKNEYGNLPQISCTHDVKNNKIYLAELRLCFDKTLKLIDCGNIVGNRGLTNCPENSKVIYPDKINPEIKSQVLLDSSVDWNTYNKLLKILNFLKFLLWVSM